MATRATPPLLKDLNERTVLDAIHGAAPISRAEISRRVGISKPTVSLALQSLLQAGLVRETEHGGDGPSYGATFFEPVPEAAFVLGLDLGARFVRGTVCDVLGKQRGRQDLELAEPTAASALETIEQLVASLLGASDVERRLVDTVVLGVPGAVQGHTIKLATNVAGLDRGDFGAALATRLALPVTLENDINLAALGERWQGVARGVQDFVFISIGTGLGAGLVLRDELHRGHTGAAGELDYLRVGMPEDIDPCAGALTEYARGIGAPQPDDLRSTFAAARAGHPVARQVAVEAARRIALHLVPLAAVTDVGLVVLGGGIGANADLVTIRGLLAGWLPSPPQVEASRLGDGAVLAGAVAVGLREARENVFVNRRAATR